MDILNFISWIKGGRVVKTVDPAQTLLPVGLKDNRRDDGYLAGAMSVQDLVTQITPVPAYKVYTALLTQSGGNDIMSQNIGFLTIGVSYIINDTQIGMDFTNVGALNNNVGTYFIAIGTTPNSWGIDVGAAVLNYSTGAPVATVMENTLGFNPIFMYGTQGGYVMRESIYGGEMQRWQQNNIPITVFINCGNNTSNYQFTAKANFTYEEAQFYINSFNLDTPEDDVLSDVDGFYKTSLEIRVYE